MSRLSPVLSPRSNPKGFVPVFGEETTQPTSITEVGVKLKEGSSKHVPARHTAGLEELNVLEFYKEGGSKLRRTTRLQIFQEVRDIAFPRGRGENLHFNIKTGVQLRDMRMVDPTFTSTTDAAVLAVRPGTILIAMEQINTVIVHNKCFVFIPEGADSILEDLMARLREPQLDEKVSVPFELRALEAVLITVCKMYDHELNAVQPLIEHILSTVLSTLDQKQLDELRILDDAVGLLAARIQRVKDAISAVLDEDSDMANMYLTRFNQNPHCVREEAYAENHDEVELMLESYLQELQSALARSLRVAAEIDSSETLMEFTLSNNRNKLLKAEAVFTLVAMVASLGSMVTGIFGMNLRNDHEDDNTMFVTVVFGMCLMMMLIVMLVILYLRQQKLI